MLGSRRVRDVAPSEIARLIRDYRDRAGRSSKGHAGGKPAARALLAACKGLFRYAVANRWIEQSPAAQITTAIVGPRDRNRDRVLTDSEIRFVMTTNARPGPILRFLLATGLRIGEAYNGHREGQYWVEPPAASKNGRAHHVWLSPVALAQLEYFPWEPPRHWVQKWLNKANTGGWTAHDLRRTFSTRNNAMGVAPYVVEKMINHLLPGMMGIYNHATYDTERREALEAWSGYLLGFSGGSTGENVVPLRAKAPQAA